MKREFITGLFFCLISFFQTPISQADAVDLHSHRESNFMSFGTESGAVVFRQYGTSGRVELRVPESVVAAGGILDPARIDGTTRPRVCADDITMMEGATSRRGDVSLELIGYAASTGEMWGNLEVKYSGPEAFSYFNINLSGAALRDCTALVITSRSIVYSAESMTIRSEPELTTVHRVAMPAHTIATPGSDGTGEGIPSDPTEVGVPPPVVPGEEPGTLAGGPSGAPSLDTMTAAGSEVNVDKKVELKLQGQSLMDSSGSHSTSGASGGCQMVSGSLPTWLGAGAWGWVALLGGLIMLRRKK